MFFQKLLCYSYIKYLSKHNLKHVCGIKQKSKINPEFDSLYIFNKANISEIEQNIIERKGVGNITLIHELLKKKNEESNSTANSLIMTKLQNELMKLPNNTHPSIQQMGDHPKEIKFVGSKPQFNFKPNNFANLSKKLNILRNEHLGNFTSSKTYYLMSDLAELEQALIQYTTDYLEEHNFELISVPDLLEADIIESCGMNTSGERNQVYKTLPDNLCLSGTSEMALAGYFSGRIVPSNKLPMKVMAVSRCYRAETSGLQEEKGIYRVHNFTKVEMFSVCTPSQSEEILEHFKEIQINIFNRLGLHFKILDMPPCELGAPAYRKYDIEAWMPGKSMYGEISSCSNCTDYQTRRLDIRCNDNDNIYHAHTVNGTACAIPRMLISILENYQNEDGTINIPDVLQKYMGKKNKIFRAKSVPVLKLVKNIREQQ